MEGDCLRKHLLKARDLNDQLHASKVESANRLLGEQASSVLTQCYLDGYNSVQNDDHTFRNDPKLGPKYVARCDKIANAIKKRSDVEEKRHQKETSQLADRRVPIVIPLFTVFEAIRETGETGSRGLRFRYCTDCMIMASS